MKLLGEKKKGIEYLYFLLLILSVFLILIGIKQNKEISGFIFIIMGIVFILLGIYLIVDILKCPKNIIVYKEIDNSLILNNRVIVSVSAIDDVSFINARSKSIVWKWGTVIVKYKGQIYKCKYVKDCEKVAKTLMKLMYKNEL